MNRLSSQKTFLKITKDLIMKPYTMVVSTKNLNILTLGKFIQMNITVLYIISIE